MIEQDDVQQEVQQYEGGEPALAPSQPEFNPSEHFIKVNGGKEYLQADHRIKWFRSKYPHGKIRTTEILVDLDREVEKEVMEWSNEERKNIKAIKTAKGYARFFAEAHDGLGGEGTGTKTETAIDFPDFVEKAETGAIARALKALGFSTLAAQLEGEGVGNERYADTPLPARPKSGQNKPTGKPSLIPVAGKKPQPAEKAPMNGKGNGTAPTPKSAPAPKPVEPQQIDGLKDLTEAEQFLINNAWELSTEEERMELLAASQVSTLDRDGYRALLAYMGTQKITPKMVEKFRAMVKTVKLPITVLQEVRDVFEPIKGKLVEDYNWKYAAALYGYLLASRPYVELGEALDPMLQHIRLELNIDHPFAFYRVHRTSKERFQQYLDFLKGQYLKKPELRKQLTQEVRDRHQEILAEWDKQLTPAITL